MALTAEQHEARAKGIGGSESAAACGISPWTTPVQLYQIKRGEVPPPNLDDNELVLWGGLLEDVIAQEWARRHKQVVHRVNDTKYSKEHDFMLAHIDRRVVGKREGLEVKNASQWTNEAWGEVGSDDVPLYYLTQGIHYMHVLDYSAWNYAVLLGGNQMLSYRVERDSELEKRVIAQEARFWECVQTARPPPPIRVDDLARLYPKTSGRITASDEILEAVARYREIKAIIKPLDDDSKKTPGELQRLKLMIGSFMGSADELYDPIDVTLLHATYRSNDETRVDSKAVREGLLRQKCLELLAIANYVERRKIEQSPPPPPTSDPLAIAKYEHLGAEKYIEQEIVSAMLRTSQVRKFLPK
jgi:putative phage-type endonuclease